MNDILEVVTAGVKSSARTIAGRISEEKANESCLVTLPEIIYLP